MRNSSHKRRRFVRVAVGSALIAAAGSVLWGLGPRSFLDKLPTTWRIRVMSALKGVSVDHGQRIAMPDGTSLAASLYRPRAGGGELPTILIRMPYHRLRYAEGFEHGIYFASQGYAVLVQDLRGTGQSGGELLPWAHAADDASATIEWITRQPWSNGKVGTFGCSALGETQLVSQDRAPAAWRAIIASGAGGAVGSLGGRYGYFGLFEGGIFQLASGFGWFAASGTVRPDAPPAKPFDRQRLLRELPIVSLVERVRPSPNGYKDYLTTPLSDERWRRWGFLDDTSRLRVPALIINTWGDQTLQDTLALAEHWRTADPQGTRDRQKVIIAPGNHCGHTEASSGRFGELAIANAQLAYGQLYLRWFDYWLRDKTDALKELSAYNFYVVGADKWLAADSWPPSNARRERWHLGSSGQANSRDGNGRLALEAHAGAASDVWRYDPADPVPSRGGPLCCTGDLDVRSGPTEQIDVEKRADVLVYTSGAMPSDYWIAGPVRAHLVVSSDAPDTDIIARLVHVWPDGRATSIQEGALRVRYRNGFDRPELLEPGKPVRITVDMRSIAYRLPAGHRLRLHVTSSSFPRLERNLNTGGDNASETRMAVATNRVHYDFDGGSWLELPRLR